MTRKILALALLLIVLPSAYASGDPSVVFFGLAQVLILGGAIVYVLAVCAPLSQKGRALLSIVIAGCIVLGCAFVPDYTRRAIWLEPLSFVVAVLGALSAWRLVRHN